MKTLALLSLSVAFSAFGTLAQVEPQRGRVFAHDLGDQQGDDDRFIIKPDKLGVWDRNQWQVALIRTSSEQPYEGLLCSGVLVASDWVVTAAHCVYDACKQKFIVQPQDFKVLSGTDKLVVGAGRLSPVAAMFVHESYNPTNDYDIALLKLKHSALGKSAVIVTLAEESSLVKSGEVARVTGWGRIAVDGPPSPILLEITVPLVNRKMCESNNSLITSRMLCAGDAAGTKDACYGDSGGPLTNNGKLIGLVGAGESCGTPGKYGIYTRIAELADWITSCIADSQSCAAKTLSHSSNSPSYSCPED